MDTLARDNALKQTKLNDERTEWRGLSFPQSSIFPFSIYGIWNTESGNLEELYVNDTPGKSPKNSLPST